MTTATGNCDRHVERTEPAGRLFLALTASLLVYAGCLFAIAAAILWRTSSSFANYRPSEPSRLYARMSPEASPETSPEASDTTPDAGESADGGGAVLLASYYGPDLRERRMVTLDELPPHVIEAVLAAEDRFYFHHDGIAPLGIARAAWSNVAAGSIQQGGSTITQQLVKNLYLSDERSLARKTREAWLALLLELRYDKREILAAYLNEIYMGSRGPVSLVGIGAAAHAVFGKPAANLSLDEAALLAGLIRSPGATDPLEHPEAALARRNWVLESMARAEFLTMGEAREAMLRPLQLAPGPVVPATRAAAGHFAAAMAAEARERYGIPQLEGTGYALYSTLDPANQEQASLAVAEGLDAAAATSSDATLEAALISLDPRDGAIRAWVGGRDYSESQFDRVAHAHRQAGSVFKPFVYASALQNGVSPADLLVDSPIMVRFGNQEWRPRNDDGAFRGPVTVHAALENSLNIPTVRLALSAGLENVAATARAFGLGPVDAANDADAIGSGRAASPALALGAVDVSPLQLAVAYGALAQAGVRREPHGLERVTRGGEEVAPVRALAARRVLDPDVAYLITTMLQGVLRHGTGASARRAGLEDPLAGKTGTSDDRRDSWFAGYAPERVAVVWVGRDDNRPTRLSGSRVALPIWTQFMLAARPAEGFAPFEPTPGVVEVEIDPTNGMIAGPACPVRRREKFLAGRAPIARCASFHTDVAPTPETGTTILAAGPGATIFSGSRDIVLYESGSTPEGGPSHILFRRLRPAAVRPLEQALPALAPMPVKLAVADISRQ